MKPTHENRNDRPECASELVSECDRAAMRRQARALAEIDNGSRDVPLDPELLRTLIDLVNPVRRDRGLAPFDADDVSPQ